MIVVLSLLTDTAIQSDLTFWCQSNAETGDSTDD